MNTPLKQRDQLNAADAIVKAFGCRATPSQAALSIFPARVNYEPDVDASEVNDWLNITKNKSVKRYRVLQMEANAFRESVERPDSALKFLFRSRKNHMFTARENGGDSQQEQQRQGNTPSSPFLRRAASRDPIHKIKDEPISPMPLSQVNGTPVSYTRSRSKLRSHSMSGNVKDSPASLLNSVEKATSAVNPMYYQHNMMVPTTPGRPFPSERPHLASKPPPPPPVVLPTTVREPPPYPGKPVWARTGVSPTVPHDVLNRELRGALQGIAGMYFVNDGRGSLIISKTCSVSESTVVILEDLLSLGNAYLDVKRQCSRGATSVTKEALMSVVSQILEEYLVDVGDISLKNAGQRGPLALIAGTADWKLRLGLLRSCMAIIDHNNIDLLENLYILWKAAEGTEGERTMTRVLDATLGVFCNSLRSWICYGQLINDDKWIIEPTGTDGFKIGYQPSFMATICLENVLKIGSSLTFVPGGELERLEEFRTLVEANVTAENLYKAGGRLKMGAIFTLMADWVGRKVYDRLMNEGHLMLHLEAARKFLLLDDAQFAAALYRCIQRMTTGIGMTRDEAFNAFVTAIRHTPTTSAFPFKVVIDTLASPESTPIGSARSQFMQSIHPLYRVKGIVEKVFRGSQQGYETLFHFIWSIQTALFQSGEICMRLRECSREAAENKGSFAFHRLMSAVSSRFNRILVQLRQYTVLMIAQCSSRLRARLDEVTNVESANEQHLAFLDDLQKNLFCDQEHENIGLRVVSILQLTNELLKQSGEFEEAVFSQDSHVKASETLRDFEAEEMSLALSEQKTRLKMSNTKLEKALEDLFPRLAEAKDRIELLSMVLVAQ